ncbi:hypothetical protein QFZ96_000379 [Paraburkholderia youngii]
MPYEMNGLPLMRKPFCQSIGRPRIEMYVAHALYALVLSVTDASTANTSPSLFA